MPSRKVIREVCLNLPTRVSKGGSTKTYTHPMLGIRMTFPIDWNVAGGKTVLCGQSPVASGAKEGAVVSVIRTDEFNSRTPLWKHVWEGMIGIVTPINERELKLNGMRAYEWTIASNPMVKRRLRMGHYLVPMSRNGYVVSTHSLLSEYILYAAAIDLIVKSFRIIKPGREKS